MTDTGIPGIEEKSLDPRHLAPFEDAHGFFRQTVSIGEKLESGVRRVEGVNFSARESLYVLAAWVEAAKEHNSPFGPSSCFTLCCRTRISSRRGRDWERLQESVGYGQTGGGARLPRKRETCHSRSGVQFRKARKRDVRVAGRCVAEAEQCTLPARAGGVGHGGAALLLSDGRARPRRALGLQQPRGADLCGRDSGEAAVGRAAAADALVRSEPNVFGASVGANGGARATCSCATLSTPREP